MTGRRPAEVGMVSVLRPDLDVRSRLQERVHTLEANNRALLQVLVELTCERDEYRAAFDGALIGYCVLDAASKIIAANEVAVRLLSAGVWGWEGRPIASFFDDEGRGAFLRHMHRIRWNNQPHSAAIDVRARAAKTIVRLRVWPAPGIRNPRRCVASLEEVSHLHAMDDTLARVQRVAALVDDVYYHTDEAGRINDVSAAYDRVWCRPAAEARGQPWFHAVHPDDRRRVAEARQALLKGEAFDEQYRIVRSDGSVRWLCDRACLVREPTSHVIGVARDVTETRALEDELRQAQKAEALGTLAGSAVHDFGNLLQGIMGCLNMALHEQTPSERSREYMRQALAAVRGGSMLVRQLLKFGRKDQVRPRPIVIDQAIEGCASLLQRLLGDRIELSVERSARESTIVADPAQVEQILMNLAANARDAMPMGGRLSIRTEEVVAPADAPKGPATWVRLEVEDIGCGMDPETRQRVFEPYFTTKAAGKGTGLGLSGVRAVTRALGGRVHVESELGEGTRFVFHFPTAALAAAPSQHAPTDIHFIGRALLVDDDWRVRISVRRYLEELGFEVLEAHDAVHALSRTEGAISLLVADVLLDDVPGPTIKEMLRGRYPDLKALYMSAHPSRYLMDQGLLHAGDLFLQKPFELPDLARRLKEL